MKPLLVDPSSPQAFIDGMADAMVRLASSAELRRGCDPASSLR